MRTYFVGLACSLAFASGGAQAQDWAGTNLVPTLLDGVEGTSSTAYGQPYGGTVIPMAPYCTTPNAPQTSGNCSSAQASSGGVTEYLPSGPSRAVTSIPTSVTAPGSKVGIAAAGLFADSSSTSGVSSFFGYVPLSAFSNGANGNWATVSQVNAVGARVDTLTTSQSANSARIDALVASQSAVNSKLDAVMNQQVLLEQMQQAFQLKTYRGIALASSLSMLSPAEGAHNRLGVGFGTFGGSDAMSLNYTHQSGNLDFGAAAAWAGSDSLAKVNVGVSW